MSRLDSGIGHVPGWQIHVQSVYAFSRHFTAYPDEEVLVTYHTPTYVDGRPTDASFLARVSYVRVDQRWDEGKQRWWGSAGLHLQLINPKTGNPYKSSRDWKSELIYPGRANDGVKGSKEFLAPFIEATNPRTVITVLEEPES